MIYEYALEPAVLYSWAGNDRDYAEFLREYGIGSPRIVSSFPKKKKAKLRSFFFSSINPDDQTLRGRRYTEMVTKIVEELALRDIVYNPDTSWQELVISENARLPFGVIISKDAISTERNITPKTMYKDNSLWHCPRQFDIQRTNERLSAVIGALIRLSTQRIIIIDTFGWTTEAINFMRYIISSIAHNRVNSTIPKISIFYKEKQGGTNTGTSSPNAAHVRNAILMNNHNNVSLDVAELKEVNGQDVFHNRCVLTELGGVSTGHGIGVSGQQEHTDEAYIMEPEIYYKKWKQFADNNCFDVVSQA